MPVRLTATLLLAVFSSLPALAQSHWRTYIGTFSSRWKTRGLHGHDQPLCAPARMISFEDGRVFLIDSPDCGPSDFARANLDNSIGFRLGRERDFAAWGPLRLGAGVEGGISHTEYNISQVDFTLVSAALTGGADLSFSHFGAGARVGLGVFTSTAASIGGMHSFRELHVTLPLRPGASVRFSRRTSREDRPRADANVLALYPGLKPRTEATETSLMFVATPDSKGSTEWDFAATSGTSTPGIGGKDLGLHSAAFQRLTVFRDLGGGGKTQLAMSWTSSAHESNYFTTYNGYPGNQRGKTINGFAVAATRTLTLPWHLSLQAGGGIEVADWRDPHHLLVDRDETVAGGVELAFAARASLRSELSPGVAIDATFEQLRWRSIGLGEARWSFGIVLTH
jgi:hypothetical protein